MLTIEHLILSDVFTQCTWNIFAWYLFIMETMSCLWLSSSSYIEGCMRHQRIRTLPSWMSTSWHHNGDNKWSPINGDRAPRASIQQRTITSCKRNPRPPLNVVYMEHWNYIALIELRAAILVCTPLSTYLSVYQFACLPVWLSIHLSIYPSIHLSIYPSIHLSIYPSIHLSIYLSICPANKRIV